MELSCKGIAKDLLKYSFGVPAGTLFQCTCLATLRGMNIKFYCHLFGLFEYLIKLIINVFSHILHIFNTTVSTFICFNNIYVTSLKFINPGTGCSKRYNMIIPTINSNLVRALRKLVASLLT